MNGRGFRWQHVGDTLAADIDGGRLAPGVRLPADTDLATSFGVNRHTVRRALQHLQEKGLLRSEKGRGTFVVDDVMQYRLGTRTRFTQNLLEGQRVPGRTLIALQELPAADAVAERLDLPEGGMVIATLSIGTADGAPISLGQGYFPAKRFPGLKEYLSAYLRPDAPTLSITEALRASGVEDYRRRRTCIVGRTATTDELRRLRMPSGECVVETEAVDVDDRNVPVTYARTVFRAALVQFIIENY